MNIIIYCHLKWEKNYCKEFFFAIAKTIKQCGTVICVDRPINVIPDILLRPRAVFKWLKSDKPNQLTGNMILVRPMIFIHDQIAKYFILFSVINRRMIKKQLKKYVPSEDLLVTYIIKPDQYDYLKIFDKEISVYECYAEAAKFPGINRLSARIIRRFEAKTSKLADIILTVSQELYRRRKKINRETHYLPWAAEYKHFSSEATSCKCVDLLEQKRPRVGFIGNIWGIFEVDLVRHIAEKLPDCSIILIGELSRMLPFGFAQKFRLLCSINNIHWLGYKEHRILPGYLRHFDVCIMPYKIDDWTLTCSPSKFYQYLAQGKPIISTPLPEVMKFKDNDIVRIAFSYDEFVAEVKNALIESPDENKMNKRKRVAKNNSWDNRADKMIQIIKTYGN